MPGSTLFLTPASIAVQGDCTLIGNNALKTPFNACYLATMALPSTESSHGNDPDYRFGSAPVRWRRILGSQSRPLVMNCMLPTAETSRSSDWNNVVRSPLI
jgi:hypothetical protein